MTVKKFIVCDVCGVINKPHKSRLPASWLCPEHRPDLTTCEGCHQKTRPYSSDARLFPGTVARGRSKPTVLCSVCHVRLKRNGTLELTALVEATPEEKSATLRLLETHNALDLAEMLGLQREENT